MNTPDESLILRSIYLPKQLDSAIKTLAFRQNTEKNEIIRNLLAEKIAELRFIEEAQARVADNRFAKQLHWAKLNGGMAAYLSDWMDSHPVEPITALFIATKPNPSRYALSILKALGVNVSKPASGIFTGQMSPPQIVALTERRFIIKVAKSAKLNYC